MAQNKRLGAPPDNCLRVNLTRTNYISMEREFNSEIRIGFILNIGKIF